MRTMTQALAPYRSRDLRDEMVRSIFYRNHGPVMSKALNVRVTEYTCQACGMTAKTDTHPAPNGIEIGGTMVALDCDGKAV